MALLPAYTESTPPGSLAGICPRDGAMPRRWGVADLEVGPQGNWGGRGVYAEDILDSL